MLITVGEEITQHQESTSMSDKFVLVIPENLKNNTHVSEDDSTTNRRESTDDDSAPNRGRPSTPIFQSSTPDCRRSLRHPTPINVTPNKGNSRTSTPPVPMAIDSDNYGENRNFDDRDVPSYNSDDRLTTEKFMYTMNLLDGKINSLYKLCRHISDQQQKNTLSIQKLSAVDELSKDFWNVSF